LPAATAEKSRVYLLDVPGEAEKLIWQMQAQALAPLVAAGKLGCVLFQFPHWFTIPGVLTSATFRSFVARRRRVSTAIRASDAAHPIEHVLFFRLGINAG
jgi:uncharacterized protein YecE (DUF72 family)